MGANALVDQSENSKNIFCSSSLVSFVMIGDSLFSDPFLTGQKLQIIRIDILRHQLTIETSE